MKTGSVILKQTNFFYFSKQFQQIVFFILTVLLLAAIIAAAFMGPDGFGQVNSLRLNRVLLGVFTGAALSASGCALQALLKNPLADPYIIGVSGGSAVGGTIAIVFFGETLLLSTSVASICGAFLVALLLGFFLRRTEQGLLVLLAGVAINAFAGAFITIVKVVSPIDKTRTLLYWLIGNIGYISNQALALVMMATLLGLTILFLNLGSLHLLGMGDEEATRLGVDVARTKRLVYFSVSLMVGITVAFCGMIGFVGLIVPQLLRIFLGFELRIILPASALLGAILLTLSDGLSRLSFVYFYSEIPVGAITALIGAPIFAFILFRHGKYL